MRYDQRVIIFPLTELWNDLGPVSTKELRDLSADDIRELLWSGDVRFVIANVGDKPQWIPAEQRYNFWKNECLPHLSEPNDKRIRLEDFPDCYCYYATEWKPADGSPIVCIYVSH